MSSLIPRLDTLEIACSRGGRAQLERLEAGALRVATLVIRAGVAGRIINAFFLYCSLNGCKGRCCKEVAELGMKDHLAILFVAQLLLIPRGRRLVSVNDCRTQPPSSPRRIASRVQSASRRLVLCRSKNIANTRRINNRYFAPICGRSCDFAGCLSMSCPLSASLVNFLWKTSAEGDTLAFQRSPLED